MTGETSLWLWSGFILFILLMLALDLGVFHRKAHVVGLKEATYWSIIWIVLALIFNLGVYFWQGSEVALQFFTGYLIEKALSIDNIFVFLMIFSFFAVPTQYQHRILFWGILGALIMRGVLIVAGSALVSRFHWVLYIFGVFLIITGFKMLLHRHEHIEPEKNYLVRLVRRFLPMSERYQGQKFFLRDEKEKIQGTPLLLVLLIVESTDLIFAVDSIPAIFAITEDPFIIFTSNVFAILGLRALYFLLAGVMEKFRYLKTGLSLVLVFVGIKC